MVDSKRLTENREYYKPGTEGNLGRGTMATERKKDKGIRRIIR